MIGSSVITWLSGGTAAATRVYTGARLQSTALPAIVVEVGAGEPVVLGPGTRLHRFPVTLRAVAETMVDAQTIAIACDALMRTGSQNAGGCSWCVAHPALEEPSPADGDEQEPAICTAQHEVLLHA